MKILNKLSTSSDNISDMVIIVNRWDRGKIQKKKRNVTY